MTKLIFLFPGQGSQDKKMIINLYKNFNIIKNTIKQGSRLLHYDILKIITKKKYINDTLYIQPIILTINTAIWRLWNQKKGQLPNIFAGHSLGEYNALICNNTITLKQGLKLIQKRANLMKKTSNKFKMTMMSILGITLKKIKKLYLQIKKRYYIEISNINSKKQTIISIKTQNITLIKKIFEKEKAKCFLLKVNIASHCNIMFNISKEFKKKLKKTQYKNNTNKIIHNLNINYCQKKYNINNILSKHLYKKVKWIETMKYLEFTGIKNIIECGTNKILKNLTKRMTKLSCKSINNYDDFKKNLQKY